MNTVLHEEAKRILFQALDKPPEDRSEFIASSEASQDVKEEVVSLLSAYDSGSHVLRDLASEIHSAPVDSPPPSNSPSDKMIGRSIGHYAVSERLGGGGMGVVYKAFNEKLDRHAALKFLSPALSADDVARKRFTVEARAASALDHPNICAIYDIDQTDSGQVYIAMAYYDGESLKDRLLKGAVPIGEVLTIATQIAEGLSRAHAGGIVHRDIKPANIMITTEGVVKIVDFGVAKMGDVNLTQSGSTMGTMAYMSPEQIQGKEADSRADIWAFGVVMYEMITGERPFSGAYQQAVAYAIINADPTPVTALRTGVPEDLAAIVTRCLIKDPDERYQTTSSLFAQLYHVQKNFVSNSTNDDGRGQGAEGTNTGRKRVFISYNRGTSDDGRVAEALSKSLGSKHDVFIERTVTVGARWIDQIEAQINRSDYMIVLLSSDSLTSEMVLGEIELARKAASENDGRPAILPIRINYRKPFSYPLSAYLDGLNWAYWDTDEDTRDLISVIESAVAGSGLKPKEEPTSWEIHNGDTGHIPAPLAAAQPSQLELPEGTMDPQSAYYIIRPEDLVAQSAASRQGVTITIKGPRQMGKSSLLMRTMTQAMKAGKKIVFLDFQLFDAAALADSDTFYRQFCTWLTDELDLEDKVEEYWRRPLGNSQRCTRYVGRHLLKSIESPVFLAMDEVERVFDTDFRSDFFSMLRSWHNDRAIKPEWRKLDIALVTSTEPYQLIENLNQSPFNVGEVIDLRDFTESQVAELNVKHGEPLDAAHLGAIESLLSGHPYLVRKALFLVSSGRMSADELLRTATDQHGPFGDHLRYHLFRIHDQPDLVDGFQTVIRKGSCESESIFWRLRGAGLVKRSGSAVVPRCRLYGDYFKEHLHG